MARRRSRAVDLVFSVTVNTLFAPLLGLECVRWRQSTIGTQALRSLGRQRQVYPHFIMTALAQSSLPKQIADSLVTRSRRNSPVETQIERCQADSARDVQPKYFSEGCDDSGKTSVHHDDRPLPLPIRKHQVHIA
ncbi:hypothetical protein KEM48_000380 [Puccinia striiformis f. sp. tritici PST-130]|nr:hypothetical protein KEM48_000380 [Puccinia striiformis f. sp. tritici PST-130]